MEEIEISNRLYREAEMDYMTAVLPGERGDGNRVTMPVSFILSPQRLVYYRDNWYLDAWCHTREDLRSFSVDAIAHARPLDEAAQDAQPLALADRFDAGYGIFSSATEMRWARLRFNAYKARWVSQEQWHPRQRASLCDDGSMLLEVPYHDPRELAMDVLKHGGDCEVIEPPELRALVVAQARAILDRHAD